jgi:hypothetical protein
VILDMFYGTQAETAAFEVGLNSIHLQVALLPGKSTGYEPRHSRIRV